MDLSRKSGSRGYATSNNTIRAFDVRSMSEASAGSSRWQQKNTQRHYFRNNRRRLSVPYDNGLADGQPLHRNVLPDVKYLSGTGAERKKRCARNLLVPDECRAGVGTLSRRAAKLLKVQRKKGEDCSQISQVGRKFLRLRDATKLVLMSR